MTECPPLEPIPYVFEVQTNSGLLRRVETENERYSLVVQSLEFRTARGWIIAGEITATNKTKTAKRVRYRRRLAETTGHHVSNDVTVCQTPEHLLYLVEVRLEMLETESQRFVIRPE